MEGTSAEERNWAMAAHLSALAGYVVPGGWVLGPLVVWQTKKEFPLVVDQGKESLNFQITLLIFTFVAGLLVLLAGLGLLLLLILPTYQLILVVLASVKAANGERYRYPLTLRFIT